MTSSALGGVGKELLLRAGTSSASVLEASTLTSSDLGANSKTERLATCVQLETDYRDRFIAVGVRSFNCWANRTTLGADLDFGVAVGRTRSIRASFGARRGLLRRTKLLRPIHEADTEVRAKLEEWLAAAR
jgi:hypothetical protein